jgi:catechol 2,3-dioxygenase-like lactoylglutathione lyase family enzyme
MVGVERFRHIGIVVRDLDLMVAFYTYTLGLTLKRTFEVESEMFAKGVDIPGARAKGAHLMMGETEIELLQFLSNLSSGFPSHAKKYLLGWE